LVKPEYKRERERQNSIKKKIEATKITQMYLQRKEEVDFEKVYKKRDKFSFYELI